MGQFTIFLVLIVLVSFLLVVVIMVQNPKGGGLSSSFGGSGGQQIGGVKKTSDFLDKSTWALATMLLVLILLSSFTISGPQGSAESKALNQDDAATTVPITTPQSTSNNTATVKDSVKN
ncbi:preprotein translocase subunit SecG [Flavobacteriaceae bacterium LMO-SS05]|jgi:preprotein translocase subunit SecG